MKVILEGNAAEIATLVVAIQERQNQYVHVGPGERVCGGPFTSEGKCAFASPTKATTPSGDLDKLLQGIKTYP